VETGSPVRLRIENALSQEGSDLQAISILQIRATAKLGILALTLKAAVIFVFLGEIK